MADKELFELPEELSDDFTKSFINTNSRCSESTVAIGLTVYNSEQFVRDSLESIIAQTNGAFTLAIYNDASTDGSETILREYFDQPCVGAYLQGRQRRGILESWRRVYQLCKTACPKMEYFAWASDHDLLHSEWLDRLLEAMRSAPQIVLAYPLTVRTNTEGIPHGSPVAFETIDITNWNRRFNYVNRHMRGIGDSVYGLYTVGALEDAGIYRNVMVPDGLLMHELSVFGSFKLVPIVLRQRREISESTLRRQMKTLVGTKRPPLSFYVPWWITHPLVFLGSNWSPSRRRYIKGRWQLVFWRSRCSFFNSNFASRKSSQCRSGRSADERDRRC